MKINFFRPKKEAAVELPSSSVSESANGNSGRVLPPSLPAVKKPRRGQQSRQRQSTPKQQTAADKPQTLFWVASLLGLMVVFAGIGSLVWFVFPFAKSNLASNAGTSLISAPSDIEGGRSTSRNASASQSQDAPLRRVALVIGNSAYKSSPLQNPVNDAKILSKALEAIGFEVTLQTNRSKNEIKEDIDQVTSELDEGDACLIYFGGHGLQVDGENYLIPIEADVSRKHHVNDQCVSCNYLVGAMEDSDCSLRVVVLDCCRNNPFRSFTRNSAVGMARIAAPEGTVIAFATAPGQTASDGLGDNSPFAKHLADTMQAQHPRGLKMRDLFAKTAQKVKKETGQRGYFEGDISMDPFWVVAQPTGNTPALASTTTVAPALQAAPEPIENSLAAESMPSATTSGSDGPFGGEAQLDKSIFFSVTNSIGMQLNLIAAGKFEMGSPAHEKGRRNDETQHEVEITRDFYIAITEVTQGQWKKVMGTRPWKAFEDVKENEIRAASHISWDGAVSFCEKLSKLEGQTYQLPTEAQWEYSCRRVRGTRYGFGGDDFDLGRYAWFDAFRLGEKYSHPVGRKLSVDGLYDMHGNVFEWCSDWYGEDYYKISPQKDPLGPKHGRIHVRRGGAWWAGAENCRSAARQGENPFHSATSGFRVLMVHPGNSPDAFGGMQKETGGMF